MRDVPLLQSLILRHGVSEVWEAGHEALGHPPSWNPSAKDIERINKQIFKRRTR